MPFDKKLVPPFADREAEDTYGNNCRLITPGAGDQLDPAGRYYKYFTAVSDGDVTFTPYSGADGETYVQALVGGQVLQGRVRRITAAAGGVLGWFD
jgi:hypothetical protein